MAKPKKKFAAAKDPGAVLGRVYEYFLEAHATGNGGTARADISIYGQESNYTTWHLARMNLAIRGIEGQIAHGDTFHAFVERIESSDEVAHGGR